jgi:hypothetical protein
VYNFLLLTCVWQFLTLISKDHYGLSGWKKTIFYDDWFGAMVWILVYYARGFDPRTVIICVHEYFWLYSVWVFLCINADVSATPSGIKRQISMYKCNYFFSFHSIFCLKDVINSAFFLLTFLFVYLTYSRVICGLTINMNISHGASRVLCCIYRKYFKTFVLPRS